MAAFFEDKDILHTIAAFLQIDDLYNIQYVSRLCRLRIKQYCRTSYIIEEKGGEYLKKHIIRFHKLPQYAPDCLADYDYARYKNINHQQIAAEKKDRLAAFADYAHIEVTQSFGLYEFEDIKPAELEIHLYYFGPRQDSKFMIWSNINSFITPAIGYDSISVIAIPDYHNICGITIIEPAVGNYLFEIKTRRFCLQKNAVSYELPYSGKDFLILKILSEKIERNAADDESGSCNYSNIFIGPDFFSFQE